MQYSEIFKDKMIAKMTGPRPRSASALSKESGVSQATLSRWLHRAKVAPMSNKRGERRKRWAPSDKIRIVKEAGLLDDVALGEFLRREGLHAPDLERFREDVLEAAAEGFEAKRSKRGLSPEQKELRALKKELARKEKALAEAAALLVLRGKWQAFLAADEEGGTDEDSDR